MLVLCLEENGHLFSRYMPRITGFSNKGKLVSLDTRGRVLFSFFLTYLFLAALGLRCCTRASSSCGEPELLFVAVRGLLIAVASLVAEHGL